ncbi:Asp-tRNA(Asn)/Glu-tRNA(Gln) amidotransferase subunit GatC [Candidatus Dojkabacteria bacterium]|jgi:aspartyl-tRNA(Asn)/glutamyl-tRNA(Gln) amidotransferase subunit C|nr:Asp-tRNA(Asn)/Glu-tRNA(Gln) amidotransferase subunit GatC [Candidatus Dojkabacteria bacterium]
MKKEITKEEIKRIADLANIKLTEEEIEKFSKQIPEILGYVEKLNELDTKGLEFKSQTDLVNIFRKDIAGASLSQEQATSNRRKNSKGGAISISSVINK